MQALSSDLSPRMFRYATVRAMPPTEPTSVEDVAERLRITRTALKLSQAALCRLAGISKQSWNNAETADARIGIDQAIKLCQATGVTLDWIYRGVRAGLPAEINEAITRLWGRSSASGNRRSIDGPGREP